MPDGVLFGLESLKTFLKSAVATSDEVTSLASFEHFTRPRGASAPSSSPAPSFRSRSVEPPPTRDCRTSQTVNRIRTAPSLTSSCARRGIMTLEDDACRIIGISSSGRSRPRAKPFSLSEHRVGFPLISVELSAS